MHCRVNVNDISIHCDNICIDHIDLTQQTHISTPMLTECHCSLFVIDMNAVIGVSVVRDV